MTFGIFEFFGVVGLLFLTFGYLAHDTRRKHIQRFLGAVALIAYQIKYFDIVFTILSILIILSSIFGLLGVLDKKHKKH